MVCSLRQGYVTMWRLHYSVKKLRYLKGYSNYIGCNVVFDLNKYVAYLIISMCWWNRKWLGGSFLRPGIQSLMMGHLLTWCRVSLANPDKDLVAEYTGIIMALMAACALVCRKHDLALTATNPSASNSCPLLWVETRCSRRTPGWSTLLVSSVVSLIASPGLFVILFTAVCAWSTHSR